jgi:hypothetical protein
MNRFDLRRLAEARLLDADILFTNNRYSSAYYLGGYVVECALKACIAKNVRKGEFPDKAIVLQSYSHKLMDLTGVAGLKQQLQTQINLDPNFSVNWALIITWSVESRYESWTRAQARDLLTAVGDQQSGVLPWLRTHW